MLELCQGNGCPRRDALQISLWEQMKFTVVLVVVVILVLEQLPSEIRSQRARCGRGMKESTASALKVNTPDRDKLEESKV